MLAWPVCTRERWREEREAARGRPYVGERANTAPSLEHPPVTIAVPVVEAELVQDRQASISSSSPTVAIAAQVSST
jgi:hypothetical protein